jgi:hypothetical protein
VLIPPQEPDYQQGVLEFGILTSYRGAIWATLIGVHMNLMHILDCPERPTNARRWKCSEYGTYPGRDIVMENNEQRNKLPVLDERPCRKCQLITVDALLSERGYRHHDNAHELVSAANEGCRICLRICGMIYPVWTPLEMKGLWGMMAPALRGVRVVVDYGRIRDYPYPVNLRYGRSRWGLVIWPILSTMTPTVLTLFADSGLYDSVPSHSLVSDIL